MVTVLGIFSFLKLSIIDVLDIVMVGIIIFMVFRWIRGSSAMNIFIALILLLVIQVVVTALGMKMMSAIMNTLLDVGVLALLIIFVIVLLFQLTDGWKVFDIIFSTDSIANLWIFSAIMLVIACGFYFGTYRKIKTQKY